MKAIATYVQGLISKFFRKFQVEVPHDLMSGGSDVVRSKIEGLLCHVFLNQWSKLAVVPISLRSAVDGMVDGVGSFQAVATTLLDYVKKELEKETGLPVIGCTSLNQIKWRAVNELAIRVNQPELNFILLLKAQFDTCIKNEASGVGEALFLMLSSFQSDPKTLTAGLAAMSSFETRLREVASDEIVSEIKISMNEVTRHVMAQNFRGAAASLSTATASLQTAIDIVTQEMLATATDKVSNAPIMLLEEIKKLTIGLRSGFMAIAAHPTMIRASDLVVLSEIVPSLIKITNLEGALKDLSPAIAVLTQGIVINT